MLTLGTQLPPALHSIAKGRSMDTAGFLGVEERLRERAETAYARARREVFGGGPTPAPEELSTRQREILEELQQAEFDLEAHRAQRRRGELIISDAQPETLLDPAEYR